MIYINEKKHISTIIRSLNKDYKRSKKYGELKPLEIYYIDIIYSLIYNCNLDITDKNIKDLISLYNKISYKSENICQDKILKPFHLNLKPTFTQSESTDCGNIPDYEEYKIYYWQSEVIKDSIEDIKLLINQTFLNTKLFDTYENFEIGKTITYNNIGRICFLDSNSNTLNYEIKDSLGNITTDQYDIEQLPNNQVLIVSKNIISFGDLFIKIKKINNTNPTPIVSGIFEDTFGIEFE